VANTQSFRYLPPYWFALIVDETLTQAAVDEQFPMGFGSNVFSPINVNEDGTATLFPGWPNEITLGYGSRLLRELDAIGNPTGNQAWVGAADWNPDLIQEL
jgi:hypothetical protein